MILRVVCDTNILVSGVIASAGAPYEILENWRHAKCISYLSTSGKKSAGRSGSVLTP